MKPLKALTGIIPRSLLAALACVLCANFASAQDTPSLTLDYNESVFTVLAGMNACGFSEDLGTSLPLRNQVRAEITKNIESSINAQDALSRLCAFYNDHQQADGSRQLAQYVSLALNLGEPPALTPKLKESDLPPDSVYVLGSVPLLQSFYITAGIGNIWKKHRTEYTASSSVTTSPLPTCCSRRTST